jgi:hypothetical protein
MLLQQILPMQRQHRSAQSVTVPLLAASAMCAASSEQVHAAAAAACVRFVRRSARHVMMFNKRQVIVVPHGCSAAAVQAKNSRLSSLVLAVAIHCLCNLALSTGHHAIFLSCETSSILLRYV